MPRAEVRQRRRAGTDDFESGNRGGLSSNFDDEFKDRKQMINMVAGQLASQQGATSPIANFPLIPVLLIGLVVSAVTSGFLHPTTITLNVACVSAGFTHFLVGSKGSSAKFDFVLNERVIYSYSYHQIKSYQGIQLMQNWRP